MKLQSEYLKQPKNLSLNWMKVLVELSFLLAVFFSLIRVVALAFLCVFYALSVGYMLLQKRVRVGPYLFFLLAFLLYTLLACFWSFVADPFSDVIQVLLGYVVFAFCLYNVLETKEDCERYLRLFCLAGLAFCVYSIAFYGPSHFFSAMQTGERLGYEICGINQFGMYAGITFAICLYLAKMKKKYHYYALSILPILIVVASSSRKAMLFIFCAILFFFAFEKMQKSFFKGLLLVAGIFVGMYLILQLPAFEQILQRLQIFFETALQGSTTADEATEERIRLMEIGTSLFRESPLFGKGTSSFRHIASRYFQSRTYGDGGISAHNTYIDILVNFGVVGAVLYYLPIVQNAWKSFKGAMLKIPAFYCMFFLTAISFVLLDMSDISYLFIVSYAVNTIVARAAELHQEELKEKIDWGTTEELVEESSKYLK